MPDLVITDIWSMDDATRGSWSQAWLDFRDFSGTLLFRAGALLLGALGVAVASVALEDASPPNPSPLYRGVVTFAAAVGPPLLAATAVFLLLAMRAPIKQRDEARRRALKTETAEQEQLRKDQAWRKVCRSALGLAIQTCTRQLQIIEMSAELSFREPHHSPKATIEEAKKSLSIAKDALMKIDHVQVSLFESSVGLPPVVVPEAVAGTPVEAVYKQVFNGCVRLQDMLADYKE